MKARKSGAIVNVASTWGIYPGPGHPAYIMSKGAVATLTRCLGRDHARDGIRINAVCPNEVNTPMLRTGFVKRGFDPDQAVEELNETVPLGRIAEPEDIADCIAFLASEQARYVAGATLEVSGPRRSTEAHSGVPRLGAIIGTRAQDLRAGSKDDEDSRMTISARIGIIGGNGWLGNALAAAAVASGAMDPGSLTLSGRSDNRGAVTIPGAHWTRDNAELVGRSDVVVLSVRPDQFPAVAIDARDKLVISVMAGVSAQKLADCTGAGRIVRAMPNAAASIGKSFTPWFALPAVPAEDKRLVQALFEACGDAAEVSQESHLVYCGGLTGAGAAFPALLAQAMIEHAVSVGLPLAFARKAARGVLVDASQLLAETGDPASIVQDMIDYRGTTAAALQTMIDRGFKEAVAAGLDAASAKAAAMAAS